jgi:hypothetical protein
MKILKSIVAFIVFCGQTVAFSQSLPVIEKKMYKAPDGRLYINKALPVYLFIGTQPDNREGTIRLESESTKAYANPMYFDTEGLNTIQSPWCVDTVTKKVVLPERNIVFEVYADSKPPITRISYGKFKTYIKKGKVHIAGEAEITLSSSDLISGVDKILYSIDNKDYVEYSAPIKLTEEKEYLFKFFAYDHVGNVEEVHTSTIIVDKSAPRVQLDIKGDFYQNILADNAKLIISAVDSMSDIENVFFRFNEGKELKYSQPILAKNLPQGDYTLEYWAEDNVGNITEKRTFNFYIDKTPPTIIPEIMGKTYIINGKEFSSGRSLLKLTTIDNKAGTKEVYYSINNSEYKKYEKPVLLNNTGGKLSVRVYALDNVNNRNEIAEGTESSSLPYVDLTGPVVSYNIEGPFIKVGDTLVINKDSKIKLIASDDEAGLREILFSIDKKDYLKFEHPFPIDSEGIHYLDISAVDNVDNITNLSVLFYTDNKGPEISTLFTTPSYGTVKYNEQMLPVYPPYCGIFISATDTHTSYQKMYYSLNHSAEKLFTGFLSSFVSGYNHLSIRALDLLGNQSTLTLDFMINKIAGK